MRTRSARVSRRSQELPRSVHWISQDFGKRALARREGFGCSPGMVGAEMVFRISEIGRPEWMLARFQVWRLSILGRLPVDGNR